MARKTRTRNAPKNAPKSPASTTAPITKKPKKSVDNSSVIKTPAVYPTPTHYSCYGFDTKAKEAYVKFSTGEGDIFVAVVTEKLQPLTYSALRDRTQYVKLNAASDAEIKAILALKKAPHHNFAEKVLQTASVTGPTGFDSIVRQAAAMVVQDPNFRPSELDCHPEGAGVVVATVPLGFDSSDYDTAAFVTFMGEINIIVEEQAAAAAAALAASAAAKAEQDEKAAAAARLLESALADPTGPTIEIDQEETPPPSMLSAETTQADSDPTTDAKVRVALGLPPKPASTSAFAVTSAFEAQFATYDTQIKTANAKMQATAQRDSTTPKKNRAKDGPPPVESKYTDIGPLRAAEVRRRSAILKMTSAELVGQMKRDLGLGLSALRFSKDFTYMQHSGKFKAAYDAARLWLGESPAGSATSAASGAGSRVKLELR